MNEQHIRPTERQVRYLRYLTAQAHAAGVPYLPIERLHRDAVEAWIEYLQLVVRTHEEIERMLASARREQPAAYLQTPPASAAPEDYRPPYQVLPDAFDHEHLVGSVTREDGVEESVCVLCGVSA